jgi:hypothetical protein
MINEVISINKKVLESHLAQLEKMNSELVSLVKLRDETLDKIEHIQISRDIINHETSLLRETLNILENL